MGIHMFLDNFFKLQGGMTWNAIPGFGCATMMIIDTATINNKNKNIFDTIIRTQGGRLYSMGFKSDIYLYK